MTSVGANSFVVTILGAESTGKTTLALALRDQLAASRPELGAIALVSEYLREFCDAQQRTPTQAEQADIAREQTRRIQQAATQHALVIADTSALMTAVYSEQVFGDRSLYDDALQAHARAQLTLLTALDLPWQADGLQRDGPHVREPVDRLLRAALQRGSIPYAVISGQGHQRSNAAVQAVLSAHNAWQQRQTDKAPNGDAVPKTSGAWRHICGRCGDAGCERHLFDALRSSHPPLY